MPFACRLAGGPVTGFCCRGGGLVTGGGWIEGTGWNCCCWGGDERLFAGGVVGGDCEGGANGLKL